MKRFQGFTLVEMLVVMGILIILMTMGIAAGRFAIQRANRVQHQNAADQLYQGLQAYYADNRTFPSVGAASDQFSSWSDALGTGGVLEEYLDSKSFDGGGDATFYYGVSGDGQSVLICVTFGGLDDVQELGGYCQGNGFGVLPTDTPQPASTKDMDADAFNTSVISSGEMVSQDWEADTNTWD
jgi:prepilin-type N-terminal cleavage/methylation domain-containing protein